MIEHLGRIARETPWWPGETPFEIAVSAVLVQRTTWTQGKKATDNLKAANLLDSRLLAMANTNDIEQTIACSGFYRQKAQTLHRLAKWWLVDGVADFGSTQEATADKSEIRYALLSIKGIGPETADSILLYCFRQSVVIADAYLQRIDARLHRRSRPCAKPRLQREYQRLLGEDSNVCVAFHAGIVDVAQQYCKSKGPLCSSCILADCCLSATVPKQ